ncbi:MAG: hypothetical protein HY899_07020 [Deltaproteobacteria bacterium]|nr:hypothetical protein [Deltaproteobacteria bacterium]
MEAAQNVPVTAPTTARKARLGGRPRACTPLVQAAILRVARSGMPRKVIAAYAGISPRTLHRFLRLAEESREKRDRGRRLTEAEKELCQFCLDFHKAEADLETTAVRAITSAAWAGDWRAALAFLERRFPERWARRRIRQTVPAEEEGARPPARPALANGRRPRELPREELKAELARRGLPTEIFANE